MTGRAGAPCVYRTERSGGRRSGRRAGRDPRIVRAAPKRRTPNSGTIGAMRHEVIGTLDRVTWERSGSLMDVYPPGMYTEHRERIAPRLVSTGRTRHQHNATGGMARVIHGLDLHPVTRSSRRRTSAIQCCRTSAVSELAWHQRQDLHFAFRVPRDSGGDCRSSAQAIGPRTRFAFGGITLFTGTFLPMRRCANSHNGTAPSRCRRGVVARYVVPRSARPGADD